ncbi:MAG TPA: XTP/dITP diphosphatase [Candidatus Acidoferrales bacterium]|nr:XTP/dITP diphosphatase [Candidatus Acidoferrales bacterium]
MSKNANNNSTFKLKGKVVFFATGNINKFKEAKTILGAYGVAVGMLKLKGDEIQSDSLQEIAENSAMYAYRRSSLPIFVEDAGLFIDTLSGFPGPYAAYVYKTIHNSGIVKLMENIKDRRATFRSIISYCDEENACKPQSFQGESKGIITISERRAEGKSGFGFDPIFQPEGDNRTFAEMTITEKNSYSHRADAIRKFAEWYTKCKI